MSEGTFRILGIDPGPTQCGWALVEFTPKKGVVLDPTNPDRLWINVLCSGVASSLDAVCGKFSSDAVRLGYLPAGHVAIETFESRGMKLGEESLKTVALTGMLIAASYLTSPVTLVKRREVKSVMCGNQRATDANIRQALIDLIGEPGVKSRPGPTYGVKSHAWPALAVAVVAACGVGRSANEYLFGASDASGSGRGGPSPPP